MSPDKSLAEILANRMRAGEPLPLPLTLSILRQVCDSLAYAHALCDPMGNHLGIVHRDVNPACIWVGEGGVVTLVASTAPRGTFAYMAPEYVMTGTLDARADLFALGVVAYEMLTNQPLFAAADDRETLDRVCQLQLYPPSAFNPRVAPDIDGIVMMALARDVAYRWQYAVMMRDGIRAVAERLGLDVATAYGNPWGELFGATPAPAPPVLPAEAPASDVPPGDPDLWAVDTNQETRIQPGDPALRDVELPAPVAQAPYAPAPTAAAEMGVAPVAARASRPAEAEMGVAPVAARASRPAADEMGVAPAAGRRSAPTPASARPVYDQSAPETGIAPVAGRGSAPGRGPVADEMGVAPVAGRRSPTPAAALPAIDLFAPETAPAHVRAQPAQHQFAPAAVLPDEVEAVKFAPSRASTASPAPTRESAPAPQPTLVRPPGQDFDPELGPEPTQIGAMPLISFGDTPLVSQIGEKPRAPPAILPQPSATFLPEAVEPPSNQRSNRIVIIGLLVIVAVVAILLIVLKL